MIAKVPAAAILIDETNRTVASWPTESTAITTPAQMTEALQSYTRDSSENIKKMFFNWDREFALKVTNFVTSNLEHSKNKAPESPTYPAWPPALPITQSPLIKEDGMIFVYTISSTTQPLQLQKLDYIYLSQGSIVKRIYWSRELYDPLKQNSTSQIIHRASELFNQASNQYPSSPKALPTNHLTITFTIDRRLSEKDFAVLDGLLKKQKIEEKYLLIPKDVTPQTISYEIELPNSATENLNTELKKSFPHLAIKLQKGDNPTIEVRLSKKLK